MVEHEGHLALFMFPDSWFLTESKVEGNMMLSISIPRPRSITPHSVLGHFKTDSAISRYLQVNTKGFSTTYDLRRVNQLASLLVSKDCLAEIATEAALPVSSVCGTEEM
jgi:hypothetical protein